MENEKVLSMFAGYGNKTAVSERQKSALDRE